MYIREVDEMLRYHRALFVDLFERYSVRSEFMGEGRRSTRMTLNKYLRLCGDMELIGVRFTVAHCALAFVMSIPTVVDEERSERHMALSFTDFLECVCRLADMRSHDSIPADEDGRPLHEKLSGFLSRIGKQLDATRANNNRLAKRVFDAIRKSARMDAASHAAL